MAFRGNIKNFVFLASLKLPIWAMVVFLLMLVGCPNNSAKNASELAEGKPGELKQNAAADEILRTSGGGVRSRKANGEDKTAELANQAPEADSGSGGVVKSEVIPADGSDVDAWIDQGTWTTRRLVALSPQGPAILDLSVAIDARSLEDASDSVVERIAEQ